MEVPEAHVGMELYYTSTRGIGGKLKVEPEDFVVREEPLLPPEDMEGAYITARVRSRNWENNRMIDMLSRELGIGRREIGFAGTKDKRAITTQYMSFKLRELAPQKIELPDLVIDGLIRTSRPIGMGDLLGNGFEVSVRELEIDDESLEEIVVDTWDQLSQIGGFPNFFGIQRFGIVRPITHLVGKRMVQGDFEGAVMEYLGRPRELESPLAKEARGYLDETGDYAGALERYPREMWLERRLAAEMAAGKAPEKALARMPSNLLMMFVHAYQGYLFNRTLSARTRAGLPIHEPVEGDLILPVNKHGLPDQDNHIEARAQNLKKLVRRAGEGKCYVSGLVFGSESGFASGEPGEIEKKVIEEEGLAREDLIVPEIPRASSKGTRRAMLAKVQDFEYTVEEGLKLKFRLQKGCYATSLLREFMKAGVDRY